MRDTLKKDTITKSYSNNQNEYRWDTLYISTDSDTYVIGDSFTKKIRCVSTRFRPVISFGDFPVDTMFKGLKAPLDLKSHKLGKMFRTAITTTYNKEGVNFAGHYCFVEWGCGSGRQESVVIDVRTGKIYDGLNSGRSGYRFKKDSKMIIINSPDDKDYYFDDVYGKPRVYIFDENSKQFKEKE
ncbi:MAG TPA: hypothetical protein PKK00_06420 [Bacteroidales bacterium]|nr:hypothetical protein [Bacteroidales bacterium]HPS16924.1 hypothetical protein [Bacteroidales bacterium]